MTRNLLEAKCEENVLEIKRLFSKSFIQCKVCSKESTIPIASDITEMLENVTTFNHVSLMKPVSEAKLQTLPIAKDVLVTSSNQ